VTSYKIFFIIIYKFQHIIEKAIEIFARQCLRFQNNINLSKENGGCIKKLEIYRLVFNPERYYPLKFNNAIQQIYIHR
jgi:hypothetical protein